MKAHVIDQSLNESIVMSYYLIPPISHYQLTDIFPFHSYNDRLWLANQKPNTNSITSRYKVWNVEKENLPAKDYTLLNVNISVSTQFMDLKL